MSSLRRVLGVGFGVAVTLGVTVGSGILRSPGEVAKLLPSSGWILGVWSLGGVFALLGAASMAEVAALVGRSGGHTAIAQRALGPFPGFLVGLTDFTVSSGSLAAVALVLGEGLGVLWPPLQGRSAFTGGAALLALAALQWRGVRFGSAAQTLTSALKVVVLAGLVLACAAWVSPATAVPVAPAVPTGLALGAALAVAFQSVVFTFDGWFGAAYFAGELKDPGRSIPRAMFGSVVAVWVLYLLVNAALLQVLTLPGLAASTLPVADAARLLVGPWAERAMGAMTVVMALGTLNAELLGGPRILFALGEDRLIPEALTRVNAGGTPAPALGVSAVAALAFLATGTFEQVVGKLSVLISALYAAFYVALWVLRRREPNAPRPYRAIGYPWTTLLGFAASVAFIAASVAADPWSGAVAVALAVGSYPAYRLWRRAGPVLG